MKALIVMFDSLNRHFLPPYGNDWVHAPNFQRLAQKTTTFDSSYICSMPCMPARRDFHTGRPNFLHCSWGPLEPFDDSVPQILRENGVYTHLASDHYHYWEDGGATYHGRYNSWEFFRGQEGDPWIGQVEDPEIPENINGKGRRQDWVNRPFLTGENHPQIQTFNAGLEFLGRNHEQDNWLLQLETFDPHEPFFSAEKFKDLYSHDYRGPLFDWPSYQKVQETPEQVEHLRLEYAALVSMCDDYLGRVLDAMDEYNLWEDTMLIVWTDHGFLLGEHDCWAKNYMPLFEELARTPFFVHDPRGPKPNERRQALVQPAIDLGPTLLEFFGQTKTPDMLGFDLKNTLQNDEPVREAAIFGYFGQSANVTDGRYVLMRQPREGANLFEYTLMPTHMRERYRPNELQNAILAPPFSFSKNCPLLKMDKKPNQQTKPDLLFDLQSDPGQFEPLDDAQIEAQMLAHLERLMRQCDAPAEQLERMGLA